MARQKMTDAATADMQAALGLESDQVDRADESPECSQDESSEATDLPAAPPAVRSGDNCPTGCGAHISVLTRHRIAGRVVEYLGCRRCGFLPQAKQVRPAG